MLGVSAHCAVVDDWWALVGFAEWFEFGWCEAGEDADGVVGEADSVLPAGFEFGAGLADGDGLLFGVCVEPDVGVMVFAGCVGERWGDGGDESVHRFLHVLRMACRRSAQSWAMSSSIGESRRIWSMSGVAMQSSQMAPMAVRRSVRFSSIGFSFQAENDRIQSVSGVTGDPAGTAG